MKGEQSGGVEGMKTCHFQQKQKPPSRLLPGGFGKFEAGTVDTNVAFEKKKTQKKTAGEGSEVGDSLVLR